MFIKQQIKQQLKLNWFVTLILKKNIRPLRITLSASSIHLEQKYFIAKYKIALIIPRFKKIFYDDIDHYKTIFKRKRILNDEEFDKISANKTTPEKKKEAKKIFILKLFASISLISIVAALSVLIALFI
ncbi:MAG: hypothetical protein GY679_03220 [Mycoplasma sp.]|nr:hypothetical protein [Mycoplasma sp.]